MVIEKAEKTFQLTPSRRATVVLCRIQNVDVFQLTPSRRATCCSSEQADHCCYFNSRPHGGRPTFGILYSSLNVFQLTPSRRATDRIRYRKDQRLISTHALTEGDEGSSRGAAAGEGHFNSRPHGGRLSACREDAA